jgi:hypothetical protein
LDEKFDVVISSLAVHYIADFNMLIQNIYNIGSGVKSIWVKQIKNS